MIDTNIVIDDVRGVPAAAAFVNALHEAGNFRVSIITVMETVQGSRNTVELQRMHTYLSRATVLPLMPEIAERALQLMRAYTLSHGLTIPDAIIAATVLEYGFTPHTRNVRYFQMIPNLAVVPPY